MVVVKCTSALAETLTLNKTAALIEELNPSDFIMDPAPPTPACNDEGICSEVDMNNDDEGCPGGGILGLPLVEGRDACGAAITREGLLWIIGAFVMFCRTLRRSV